MTADWLLLSDKGSVRHKMMTTTYRSSEIQIMNLQPRPSLSLNASPELEMRMCSQTRRSQHPNGTHLYPGNWASSMAQDFSLPSESGLDLGSGLMGVSPNMGLVDSSLDRNLSLRGGSQS